MPNRVVQKSGKGEGEKQEDLHGLFESIRPEVHVGDIGFEAAVQIMI